MNIPTIENALLNITTACKRRLEELYPHGIPVPVQERYDKEMYYLQRSKYVDDFEIFRRMSNEAKKCAQFISCRGTLPGSYLIYLLGHGRFNPLQAHYYCPHCGHFEFVDTDLFGVDLPECACPLCSSPMISDGYNLTIESVWGTEAIDGSKFMSMDYNVCNDFLPFAKNVLTSIYPNNCIVPLGIMNGITDTGYDPSGVEMRHSGYAILPLGFTLNDFPDLLTYLEDGTPCLGSFQLIEENRPIKRVIMLTIPHLEHLNELQKKTGIYTFEIENKEIREYTYRDFINSRILDRDTEDIYSFVKPKTYYAMTGCYALPYNSYVDIEHSINDRGRKIIDQILETPEFKKYPCFTRNDFFDKLVECGKTNEEAYRISELIKKGRAVRSKEEVEPYMPTDFYKLASKFLFLFPKAHCIEYMLLYAKLIYYMKHDSRLYSKVVHKKY